MEYIKFATNFEDMLKKNEDEDGEPIFSMPTIEPLSIQYETYSFSIGKNIENNIAKVIDKPKWNLITFMAQLHETMASNLGALRSKDVCKHVIEYTSCEKDVNTDKLKACIAGKPLSNDVISTINASLFFTLLFVDAELNSKLSIDKKLVIANALTFATWKERLECDILLHKVLGETLRKNLHYKISREEHTGTFTRFCSIEKDISKNTIEDTLSILSISPWAGLEDVMKIVNEAIQSKKKNVYGPKGKSDRLLRDILLHSLLYQTDDMYSIGKRVGEDQWFLIEIYTIILKTSTPTVKHLNEEIEQVIHSNSTIDTKGNIDLYTKRGIEFIDRVKEDPKIKAQMNKVSAEFQEYASTVLVGILSKTGEKMIQKSVNYFIFLPIIIQLFRKWQGKGLFASLQYTIKQAFKDHLIIAH